MVFPSSEKRIIGLSYTLLTLLTLYTGLAAGFDDRDRVRGGNNGIDDNFPPNTANRKDLYWGTPDTGRVNEFRKLIDVLRNSVLEFLLHVPAPVLAKCFQHFREVKYLRFSGIEHYDHFMDETVFYAELADLPQDIQEAARAIDGPHYNPSCFGICLCYDLKTNTVAIMEETSLSTGEKCNVYYVDNNGDKKWFAVELPEDFTQQIFDACMRISTGRDTIQGYEVKDFVIFENRRGVALAENPKAPQPFVTWMFTQQRDGRRDYEWGNYFQDGKQAAKDFRARADEYQRRFGVREIKLPIAEQMKLAGRQAEANRGDPAPKKDAPDKGDR